VLYFLPITITHKNTGYKIHANFLVKSIKNFVRSLFDSYNTVMYIYHDISHLDSLKTLYNAGLRDPLIALCMLSVIKSRSERIFFESLLER